MTDDRGQSKDLMRFLSANAGSRIAFDCKAAATELIDLLTGASQSRRNKASASSLRLQNNRETDMKRLSLIIAACATASACSGEQAATAPDNSAAMPATDKMADGHMSESTVGMMAPSAGDSAATRGYKASMMSMMTDMPAYVGNPDIDFMKQMRVHHQAAIAMAQVELTNGAEARAKALAQEIIAAQQREIGVIDAWLREKAA